LINFFYKKSLEKEGIKTNVTLVFSLPQAVKCGEDRIFLISPFVGRINDFYVKKLNKTFSPMEEPGVIAVKEIYNYLKKYEYDTVVMVDNKY
jgi:transaldolase